MIYVTAQRVRSTAGEVGINAFLYVSKDGEISEVAFDEIIERPPGGPEHEIVSIEPGGNYVVSYLDVVVRDDLSEQRLQELLGECSNNVGETTAPAQPERHERSWDIDDIRVRFNWSTRIPGKPADEVGVLSDRVMRLMARYFASDGGTKTAPIEIRADQGADELVLTFEPESLRRVRQHSALEELTESITIDRETLDAFEQIHGRFLPHAADLLIPTDLDVMEDIGGVRIVDASSARTLWRSSAAARD